MKKTLLSLSLLTFLITGCSTTHLNDNVPVNDLNFNKHKDLISKDIRNYKFDIKEGTSLKEIANIVRKELAINIIFSDKVNVDIKLPISYKNITFIDYLKIIKAMSGGGKDFIVKNEGINNTYFVDILDLNKKEKAKRKTKQELISEKFNKIDFEISADTTYAEVFNSIKSDLNIEVKLLTSDNKEFLGNTFTTDYVGNLQDFLKELEYTNDLYIKYEFNKVTKKDKIIILDKEIKEFHLNVPSLVSKNSDTTINETIDIYKKLEENLKKFVSDKTVFTVDNSTQLVTAEGTRIDLEKIKNAVKSFNATYHSVIKIELNFYTVEVTKNEGYGLDLNGIVNKLVSYNGNPVSMAITTGTQEKLGDDKFMSFDFGYKENKLAVDLMNKYGETRQIQAPTLTTVNNVPTSLKIMNTDDYIKSIKEEYTAPTTTSSTTAADGTTTAGTTTPGFSTKTPEVDTIDYGFKISVLPVVDKDSDEITVIINPEFSNLKSLVSYTYESGQIKDDGTMPVNEIQLKKTSKTDLGAGGQMVKVRNGKTTVIGGYYLTEEKDNKDTLPGLTTENNLMDWIASKKSANYTVKELVIFITATKIN